MKPTEFKLEFAIKTFVQEQQFYQWIQLLFKLNIEINEKYNHNTADLFLIKFVQILSEGKNYCEKIIPTLIESENNKQYFFKCILEFIENFNATTAIDELDYLEYKRHNICHIFQNGYETIQDNLKIKTHIKNRELAEIDRNLKKIMKSENDEFEMQSKLFKNYFVQIEKLRLELMEIQENYDV